ncbi:MAG: phage holin family protein, partial [Kluyvera sp.]
MDWRRNRCSCRFGAGRSADSPLSMSDSHHAQGPGKNVLGIGQRIVTLLVQM